jgi:glucokinase-like ROK family protein
VHETGEGPSNGGRRPVALTFNSGIGLVLAADLGATRCRLAVTDLAGASLAELASDLDIAQGPDAVLPWLQDRFDDLLMEAGRDRAEVWGIGVGVPGPVEFAAGRVVNPPIMPGWHDVAVPERLREWLPTCVLVDNDVNIMALGEYWHLWRDKVEDLLFVKVGTGIGSGIIAGRRIHRGAQGAAGDIGHIRVQSQREAVCRCGNVGCVEAVASGSALARQLSELGLPATRSRDVVALVRAGDVAAIRLVRDSGRLLGEVLAGVVNFFNPAVIVIGGRMADADEQLLAGVREVVYRRSTALATRRLQIRRSQLDDRAGVLGAAIMVIEEVLSAQYVNEAISTQAAAGSGQAERLTGPCAQAAGTATSRQWPQVAPNAPAVERSSQMRT